jgi:hypothetical protein
MNKKKNTSESELAQVSGGKGMTILDLHGKFLLRSDWDNGYFKAASFSDNTKTFNNNGTKTTGYVDKKKGLIYIPD